MKLYKRKLKTMSFNDLKAYVEKHKRYLTEGDLTYIEALMEDHKVKNAELADKISKSYIYQLGRVSAIRKGLATKFIIGEGLVRHEVEFGVALVEGWEIVIKAMKKGIRIIGATQVTKDGKSLE